MKLTLEPTGQIVEHDGAACRVWQGTDEHGTPVYALIALIRVPDEAAPEDHARFARELGELEVEGEP